MQIDNKYKSVFLYVFYVSGGVFLASKVSVRDLWDGPKGLRGISKTMAGDDVDDENHSGQ